MHNIKKKRLIKNIIFFIITFPAFFFMLPIYLGGKDFYVSPQLSEQTVLSLSDNLSILEITGKSNFKNDKFHLELYEGNEGSKLHNKAIA